MGLWMALVTSLGRFWIPFGRLLGASGPLLGIFWGLREGICAVLGRIFGFPARSSIFPFTFSPHSPHSLSAFSPLSLHFLPASFPHSPHFVPTSSSLSLGRIAFLAKCALRLLPLGQTDVRSLTASKHVACKTLRQESRADKVGIVLEQALHNLPVRNRLLTS